MKNEKEEEEETTLKKLEVEKFLRKHVENRLRMNIPYLHQWPNALGNIGLNHVHLTVRHGIVSHHLREEKLRKYNRGIR